MKPSDKEVYFHRTDTENLGGYFHGGCVIYLENDFSDVLS